MADITGHSAHRSKGFVATITIDEEGTFKEEDAWAQPPIYHNILQAFTLLRVIEAVCHQRACPVSCEGE